MKQSVQCTRQWTWSVVFAATLWAGTHSGTSMAQSTADDYPSKPISVTVPSEGNGIEGDLRPIFQSIQQATGKTFIIEPRAGAAGTIGAAYVAKARPDGYSLLAPNTSFTISAAVYAELSYDAIKDFAPVTLLGKKAYLLLVNAATPYKTTREYLAYAKAHPGELNFATAGPGGTIHLPGALLHSLSGTTVTFVHYKAASQRIVDLVAGRADVTVGTYATTLGNLRAGKLRALGVTTSRRIPVLPDVPTIEEQGVPGYEYTAWNGVLAPVRTPQAIVTRLNTWLVQAIKDPMVSKKLEADGTIMVGSTTDEFRQYIATDIERWRKLIRDTGIKVGGD